MPVVRVGEGGRGAVGGVGGHGGDGGLGLTVPDELVRNACDLAIAVAQEMEAREVPPPLRRYLRMQRLPGPAVSAIRRVLDSDAAFRARVAEGADEAVIGRPAWLFLVRPEGWADELAALAAASSSSSAASADEKEERAARRRLAAVEARLTAAQVRAAEAEAAEAEARAALAAVSAARDAAESLAASLRLEVDARRHERDDARARLARAEARVAALETTLARAGSTDGDAAVVPPAAPDDAAGLDVDAVRAALAAATTAADRLAAALADAARTLPPEPDEPRPAPATTPSSPRRTRLRLPGGLFDDSVEAAEWLVRQPGVVVLVDGYNCTLRDLPWAALPIAEQRRRLVDALVELASRTHADVEVVFDGADVDRPLASGRRGVRVVFSDSDTEADDVVIARSADVPVDRPVVVASSDNRVRDGAAANGANVVSAEQLMAILRARG